MLIAGIIVFIWSAVWAYATMESKPHIKNDQNMGEDNEDYTDNQGRADFNHHRADACTDNDKRGIHDRQ